MKKLGVLLCAILCGMLVAGNVIAAEGTWELIASDDGIDTYRMTHPDTDVCTFKGIGFVDAKMEVVGEVIRDIPAYPEWMAKCKEARVLKHIDRNTKILYNVINAPFPYSDRDMVVANQTVYDLKNGVAKITFGVDKDYPFPEDSRYLRVTDITGSYYIEYFGRNKTRVTYTHRAHPGGNIPVAVANRIEIQRYPAINIRGIRKMAKKEKYIKAGRQSPEYDLIERMISKEENVEKVLKNRMGQYITDEKLLAIVFDQPAAKDIAAHVYAKDSTFNSVVDAVVDMFSLLSSGQEETLGKQYHQIEAYIQDKPLDSFFSMEKFMQEKWLLDELRKRKETLKNLLETDSRIARSVLHKISTSETAIKSFIKDEGLAQTILTSQAIRDKLWEDMSFRKELLNNLDNFDDLGDFEKLVRERVASYQ